MGENCQDYSDFLETCERAGIDPDTLKKLKPTKAHNGNVKVAIEDRNFEIEGVNLSLKEKTISCRIWETPGFEVMDWIRSFGMKPNNTEKVFIDVRDEKGRSIAKYQALALLLAQHDVSLVTANRSFGIPQYGVDDTPDPVCHSVTFRFESLDRMPVKC